MAPYRDTELSPPLSDAEIIAMILLFIGRPLTFAKLLGYTFNRFNYFAQLVGVLVGGRPSNSRRTVVERFSDALRQYDLPISCTNNEYHMNETEGLFFLRKWCSSMPCGLFRTNYIKDQPFRFLDLPREVRDMIYEMVFGLPRSGIRINRTPNIWDQGRKDRVTVMTRDLNQQFSFSEWLQAAPNVSVKKGRGRYLLHLTPLSDLLKLLVVNKQLYKEAMPVFYATNHFRCLSLDEFRYFLVAVPDRCRAHIRHVSFRYDWERCVLGPDIMSRMSSMRRLNKLQISFKIEESKKQFNRNKNKTSDGSKLYSSPLSYPGIRELAKITTLNTVELQGDCEAIATGLRGLGAKFTVTVKA